MLTRPGLEEILAYRRHVDEAMAQLIEQGHGDWRELLELGLHHEQQHQELILMDAKHLLSLNPLKPAYALPSTAPAWRETPMNWIDVEGGLIEIGHAGNGFAFDNEGPPSSRVAGAVCVRHASVNCGEYLAFIEDGGYRRPEFWLSAGWDCVNQRDWQAPLYWEGDGDQWQVFTLWGLRPLQAAEPVCHVSAYEAAAYAKWAGKRLPREQEWKSRPSRVKQVGTVWEWTASPYVAYPGFREPGRRDR